MVAGHSKGSSHPCLRLHNTTKPISRAQADRSAAGAGIPRALRALFARLAARGMPARHYRNALGVRIPEEAGHRFRGRRWTAKCNARPQDRVRRRAKRRPWPAQRSEPEGARRHSRFLARYLARGAGTAHALRALRRGSQRAPRQPGSHGLRHAEGMVLSRDSAAALPKRPFSPPVPTMS